LVSGTNSPLYTTSFSTARPNANEDLEKHEGRLAEALELDRVARVLEFRDPPAAPLKPIPLTGCRGRDPELKTVWRGTEWILGGPDHSRPIHRAQTWTIVKLANFTQKLRQLQKSGRFQFVPLNTWILPSQESINTNTSHSAGRPWSS
jgi:hypothetical protein